MRGRLRLIIFCSLFLLFSAWLIWGEGGVCDLYELGKRYHRIKETNERLMQLNKELFLEVKRLKTDPSFQDEIIRKELGWVKKGEIVFIIKKDTYHGKEISRRDRFK